MSSIKKNVKLVVTLALLLLCTLLVTRFYLGAQFPYTHDGENHLARFANYAIALKELQIPPRIAPRLHNNFGYPVFNYNYPLANILSVPFSLARLSYQTTFASIVVLSLFMGSIGVFCWLAYFTKRTSVKLFSALLWLTSPFIVSTLAYRGSIGEVLAYSLLPWVFWIVHKVTSQRDFRTLLVYSIIGAAFLLSHNITVVFALPLLIIYAAILFRKNAASWKRAFIVGLLAVCGTLWFWLPAVAEIHAAVVTETENQSAFSQHFVTLQQLLSAPITFGYSLPGRIDSLGLKIGLLSLLLVCGSFIWTLYMVIRTFKSKNSPLWSLLFFLSTAASVSVWMQMEQSLFVWERISLLRFMQFPWRWSLFFFTLGTPLFAVFLSRIHKKLLAVFVITWIFWVFQILKLKPVDTFSKSNTDYEHFTLTTSTQNENMAKNFTFQDIGTWKPEAGVLEPLDGVSIHTQVWNGRKHVYAVETSTAITIVEPTMRFLGWQTQVNGQEVEYIDSDEIQGRIAFNLEPGNHLVVTQFTQNTPARLAGNTAFFFTLVGMFYLILQKREKI